MAPQCLFSSEVLAIISLVTVAVLLDPARVSAAKSAEGHRAADDPVFQLFTRKNPTAAQILELGNLPLLTQSHFNNSLPTKIYSHGLNGFPSAQGWDLRDGFLQLEDCNFIAVDWSLLAAGDFTAVATVGVPIAGTFTGSFVDFLIDQGAVMESFHLIGFSMGAHVVGIAGSTVAKGKLPRITGLDPSTRVFSTLDDDHRLDITDAQFLDVIHTSPSSSLDPLGHVDFYPNGGVQQPNCVNPDTTCCHHCRAVYLMAESITAPTNAGFRSLECASYEQFLNGACDGNDSVLMGNPIPVTTRGSYYLTTNGEPPYARG